MGIIRASETDDKLFNRRHDAVKYAGKILKKCMIHRKNSIIVEEALMVGKDKYNLFGVEREKYFYDKNGKLVHEKIDKAKKLSFGKYGYTYGGDYYRKDIVKRKYLKKVI